jgi:predicted nucleic acid-binding protein
MPARFAQASAAIRLDVRAVTANWILGVGALADRFGISVYDACYLELGQRRGLPLVTLDSRLRSASAALGLKATDEL